MLIAPVGRIDSAHARHSTIPLQTHCNYWARRDRISCNLKGSNESRVNSLKVTGRSERNCIDSEEQGMHARNRPLHYLKEMARFSYVALGPIEAKTSSLQFFLQSSGVVVLLSVRYVAGLWDQRRGLDHASMYSTSR